MFQCWLKKIKSFPSVKIDFAIWLKVTLYKSYLGVGKAFGLGSLNTTALCCDRARHCYECAVSARLEPVEMAEFLDGAVIEEGGIEDFAQSCTYLQVGRFFLRCLLGVLLGGPVRDYGMGAEDLLSHVGAAKAPDQYQCSLQEMKENDLHIHFGRCYS